jgi:hypothetical protein
MLLLRSWIRESADFGVSSPTLLFLEMKNMRLKKEVGWGRRIPNFITDAALYCPEITINPTPQTCFG